MFMIDVIWTAYVHSPWCHPPDEALEVSASIFTDEADKNSNYRNEGGVGGGGGGKI